MRYKIAEIITSIGVYGSVVGGKNEHYMLPPAIDVLIGYCLRHYRQSNRWRNKKQLYACVVQRSRDG